MMPIVLSVAGIAMLLLRLEFSTSSKIMLSEIALCYANICSYASTILLCSTIICQGLLTYFIYVNVVLAN